uniref:Thaumatin-like protein n=1 Tax=Saccharum hybrid cultivar R570 TaxID=131158 RepID=A0A059Q2L0_9POAL|nr:hypothetical protein SHCRBa_050_A17_F_50 [Saccharum hybrid cultivar R570]
MAAAAAATACRSLHLFLAVLAVSVNGVWSKSFTITNNCGYTRRRDGRAASGGRTLCTTDGTTNKFACATGDCGSGAVSCGGGNAAPPATLAEFTLDGSGGMDFYDVSLVDGYNLPLLVAPSGAAPSSAGTNCAPTGYCCSGEYASPGTCRPSAYSEFFKNACPRAYSYAYDDATSTFTCAGGDTAYTVTFCPGTNSVKSSSPNSGAPGDLPLINGTMAYAGGDQQVGAAAVPSSSSRTVVVLVSAAVLVMLAGGALS